ncbi:MAG: polysaccharide biosynthesis tyrosine autokinase [Tunicatimonas sp.]
MEKFKKQDEESINLMPLLFKIRSQWYWFAASLLLFVGIAYVYVSYTESQYLVNAKILFEDVEVGSTAIDRELDDSPRSGRSAERKIALTNELAKLVSDNTVRRAIDQLDFNVSYYTVEKFWPSFLQNSWLNEKYHDYPFTITLDTSQPQLVGLPIYVEIVSENQVRISAEADEATLVDFASGKTVSLLNDITINEVVTVGQPYESKLLNLEITATEASFNYADYDLCFKISSTGSLVGSYKGAITATPADQVNQDARVVNLSFESPIPQKGELFLNTLIDAYANQVLEGKNDQGENSIEFINNELTAATDSLNQARQNLQSFKSGAVYDPANAMSSVYNQMNDLEDERADLQNQLEYYQSTLRGIKSSKSDAIVAPSYAGINDPSLNNYISKYIDISSRARKLNASASQANPLVKQVNEEVETLKSALEQNINGVISSLQIRMKRINGRIYALESDLRSLPQDERRIQVLQQEFDRYNEKQVYWQKKKSDAEMKLATNTANIDTIEKAQMQGNAPIWPKSGLIYAGAFLLALMLPLALIIGKDFVDGSITNKDDIENKTKAPLLGMIANGNKGAKLVMLEAPNSAISESFKFARINLQYFHQGEDSKVIGVTSSISGEGKTFCSINLSSAYAEAGQKTLFICCDLRKPRVNEYFNIRQVSIADVITGRLSIDEAIQPGHQNLDVLGAGEPLTDPIRLYESKEMDNVMAELRRRYDVIIIETPPIAYVADYFVLLKYFDVNLFIVRYKYTNKNILQGINDLYSNNKIKNLNILFNDVKYSGDYGYGYLSDGDGYYNNKQSSVKKLKNPFAS